MRKLNCVLLIDDYHPTNVLHTIAIEDTKRVAHTLAFTDAEKALTYLLNIEDEQYIKPNVIFLDINMPGMNGWDFIQEYKKLTADKKSDILLFMLSTSTHPDDLDKADKEEEVKGYIYKPLTTETMLEVIEKYFEH